ncbi:MAG TPA: hypothetical protein PLM66_02605, partial [Candidatus Latescibacteria bacterium]|nr:hypothetical protein [Candidatus Latescibacterota bacterium]
VGIVVRLYRATAEAVKGLLVRRAMQGNGQVVSLLYQEGDRLRLRGLHNTDNPVFASRRDVKGQK